MRCLITGGAGFIGSHTVDHLLARGYRVRVLASLQPRVHPYGKPGYLPEEIDFRVCDVSRHRDLEAALDGVPFVMPLAAYQDYLPDFSTFIHVNAESTALLFELIVAKDLPIRKIVFASSQSVAGEGRYHCGEHGELSPPLRTLDQLQRSDWEVHCPHCSQPMEPVLIPESVAHPHTAYGISKYAIEMLAESSS